MMKDSEILLSNPRGFCAGVDRAIDIVERALQRHGAPIYVRHEIVHNKYVVDDLRAKGAVFIEDLADVPPGATLVFSAHGVSKAVRREAQQRGFQVFDATCPLVKKVHIEVLKRRNEGYEVVMIGHEGHPEVEGTLGQSDTGMYLVESVEDVANLNIAHSEKLTYVSQTTLSVDDTQKVIDALKARFPHIVGPKQDDICYATQNRQDAVKFMAPLVEVVIVVGSRTSSNTNRLRELADLLGCETHQVDSADELKPEWVAGKKRIGVTSGASAPEILVQDVVAKLKSQGVVSVRELDGIIETITFPLPKGLNRAQPAA
ncbi:MAG: 4-hydroxy-3-methylbut-2-enyl diphosphate reductase [Betaproteobacteria bacterium]|nr:4-hydroxy-3-methylbut-2-enyl diphosphate reductase [Betaproteobacteria bacterium UKL13-2]HCG54131.1 4-hydroxy-3-methylbut-2-enyl diphosphate reductase [Betaproteobacteria bacterium]